LIFLLKIYEVIKSILYNPFLSYKFIVIGSGSPSNNAICSIWFCVSSALVIAPSFVKNVNSLILSSWGVLPVKYFPLEFFQ